MAAATARDKILKECAFILRSPVSSAAGPRPHASILSSLHRPYQRLFYAKSADYVSEAQAECCPPETPTARRVLRDCSASTVVVAAVRHTTQKRSAVQQ